MSRPTDKPMARAAEHMASARYAEAAGAFRAVLWIDPTEFQAHFGLADALTANGQLDEAVQGLVEAAESCNEQDAHAAALTLYGKALAIDPGRLELHLDVAMAEAALGRAEAAQLRLENLAEIYMQAGRTDEAAEVYRFLASWDDDGEGDEDADDDVEELEEAPAVVQRAPAGAPRPVVSTETVMVPTILVTPDGQLMQLPVAITDAPSAPLTEENTNPRIPIELIEVAHSKPIDMAEGSGIRDVDSTVVAYPPPPPQLPAEAKAAPPELSREALEAAVATAMENLMLLDEGDDTVIMRLRPKMVRKRVAPSPAPRPATPAPPPAPAPAQTQAAAPASTPATSQRPEPRPRAVTPAPRPTPVQAPTPARAREPEPPADGRLRLQPAPRPAGKPAAAASPPAKPSPAPARPSPAAAPRAQASRPAPAPAAAPRPAPAPARPQGAARPAPAPAARPSRPAPSPAASASERRPPAPAPRAATPPPSDPSRPKPTRPDNPLVDRLRRRAGLGNRPGASAGAATSPGARPRAAEARTTKPISVRDRGKPGSDPDRS